MGTEERSEIIERAANHDRQTIDRIETLLEAGSDDSFLSPGGPLGGPLGARLAATVEEAERSRGLVGRRIGHVQVERVIGGGGFGRVYLGRDDRLDRQVAVKALRATQRFRTEARERLRREARLLSKLDHPNICRIYGLAEEDDGDYLLLEYVDGEPLTDAARDIDLAAKLNLARQIAEALAAAHDVGIIHRDLKPDNILVTADGVVKVLDLGVARIEGELDSGLRLGTSEASEAGAVSQLTRLGSRLGTISYMSPEQARGENLTTASDLFAFGLLLHELFGGAPVYRDGDPDRLLARVKNGETEPLVHTDRELTALVEELLRLSPAARPTAAGAVGRIEALLDRPRLRRRRRIRRLAVAGILTAAAVGLATVVVQRNRAETEALKAQQVTEFLVDLFKTNEPTENLGEELTARQILERGEESIGRLDQERDVQARLLSVVGRVYSKLGSFDRAEPLLRRAIETAHGSGERARALSALGDLLYVRGELEEAERFHREALAAQRRARPRRHEEIAAAVHELGKTLLEKEDPEAEAVLSEALASRERLLGPTHPKTGDSLNELGRFFHSVNQCDRAIPLLRRAMEIFEALEVGGDLRAADPMANLSVCFTTQGKLEEAETMTREILARYLPVFGEDHPNVMTQWNNLAVVLAMQGEYPEAEEIMRRLLESRRAVMPAGAYMGNTLGNLGAVVLARELYAEAEPILRETIALMREKFGSDHPRLARRINSLGRVKIATGDLDQAEALFHESTEIFERTERTDHPQYFVAQRGLGRVLGARENHAEAVTVLKATLTGERRIYGESHAAVADTLEALGLVWLRSGNVTESVEALRGSLAIRIATRGETHPDTARVRRHLAEALIEAGDLSAAEPLLLEALEAQTEKLRPEHPQIASTRAALVDLYARQNRPEQGARYR